MSPKRKTKKVKVKKEDIVSFPSQISQKIGDCKNSPKIYNTDPFSDLDISYSEIYHNPEIEKNTTITPTDSLSPPSET